MHYTVTTPEYWYIEPVMDDGSGPREYAVESVCVEANTKREAIIKGVKKMRSKEWLTRYGRRFTYYGWYWDSATNPYTGVKAQSSECEHGFCYCWDIPCDNKLKLEYEDVCPYCWEDQLQNCEHEMGTSWLRQAEWSEAQYVEHCWKCLQTGEQINARDNQKFKILA